MLELFARQACRHVARLLNHDDLARLHGRHRRIRVRNSGNTAAAQ